MTPKPDWMPVQKSERYATLDLLRGFALFGVLLVNLLYFFRVHLLQHIMQPHSHPGALNLALEWFIAEFIEFKAFGLFSLTFGIGAAIQADRARSRGRSAELFLARRFLILLAIGACHMVLISNVDILMLYAVCGLLLTLLLRLPALVLLLAGIAAITLPSLLSGWPPMLPVPQWKEHIAAAGRIYSTGSFGTELRFRWHETAVMIVPLLAAVAQRTFGLMLIGAAAWRGGMIRDPRQCRTVLWSILTLGLVAGVLWRDFVFAYAAAVLLWSPKLPTIAAAGQMALTSYLTQSVVLSLLFYGYGLALFNRLDPLAGILIVFPLYAAQLAFSAWWLRRFYFGPVEWLWRSLTYGHRQPMRRGV